MGKKKTQEQCIQDFRKVWGNLYDYSEVSYINDSTPVCIICKEHGKFWKSPSNHIHKTKPQGCQKCNKKYRKTNEEWIEEFKKVHDNKYDYSETNVNDKDENGRLKIICPTHGEFWQTIDNHYYLRKGCKYCSHRSYSYTTEEWIKEANKIHGNKYNYGKTQYDGNKTEVIITCPIHGDFSQRPISHLNGQGCPICKASHMENEIRQLLRENNIQFEEQKNLNWLARQTLDFYIPSCNVAIECQGLQHFKAVEYFGGRLVFEDIIRRDKNKRKLCNENNIQLLYYANYEYNFPYEVINNKDDLLTQIQNAEKENN